MKPEAAAKLTIADILRTGKARLLECGWCQGDDAAIYAGPPRKCCAATAIGNSDHVDDRRLIAAIKFLKEVIGVTSGMSLADWNDAPERTLEDVLAAYDKAIAAAEEIARGHQE